MSNDNFFAPSENARRLDELLRRDDVAVFETGGPITERARIVAREIAESLGYCRLSREQLTGELAELNDATLLPSLAIAAAIDLAANLERAMDSLKHFESRFDTAVSPFEIDSIVAEPLICRMRTHAAFSAIDEAYSAALDADDPELPAFSDAIDLLLDRLDAFEEAMRDHLDLLSIVTDTNLLENWRSMLAPEEADPLPWWLDGTLEAVARKECEEAFATLPTAEWWESIRGNELPNDAPRPSIHTIRESPLRLPPQYVSADAAADGTVKQRDLTVKPYRWRSPDEKHIVEVFVPVQPSDGDDRPLRFVILFATTDEPAHEFIGAEFLIPTAKTGAPPVLRRFEKDDSGAVVATVTLGELRTIAQEVIPPSLMVKGELWRLTNE